MITVIKINVINSNPGGGLGHPYLPETGANNCGCEVPRNVKIYTKIMTIIIISYRFSGIADS